MNKVEVRCGKCEAVYSIDMTIVLDVIKEELGKTSFKLQEKIAEALL